MPPDLVLTGFWLSVAGMVAWPVLQLLALACARRTWQLGAALLPLVVVAIWLLGALTGGWAANLFLPGVPVALLPINVWLIGVIVAGCLTDQDADP